MPEPSMGQPYASYPAIRLSVGDLVAPNGSDAQKGVEVIENDPLGLKSTYIVSLANTFKVQVQVRAANFGLPFSWPPGLTTRFVMVNLIDYTLVADVTVDAAVTPPQPLPAPVGDHGTDGPNDFINWYTITSTDFTAPAAGIYKVMVIGMHPSIFFFHDDTVILVQ